VPTLELDSKRRSRCCGYRAQIVRSRPGGFLSQGCLKCGNSDYISGQHLPDLRHVQCSRTTSLKVKKLDGQNYFYQCDQCKASWKVADIVPAWWERFPYRPLPVDSDFV